MASRRVRFSLSLAMGWTIFEFLREVSSLNLNISRFFSLM